MSTSQTEQLLQQQLSQLKQLETILITEKDILQSNKPEALVEITSQKSDVLALIEQTDQTLANTPEFNLGRKQGLFETEMTEINEGLKTCQELNTVNGHIIEQSALAVEKMKTSLMEMHSRSSMTYDSKGKKSAGLTSLNIKA